MAGLDVLIQDMGLRDILNGHARQIVNVDVGWHVDDPEAVQTTSEAS